MSLKDIVLEALDNCTCREYGLNRDQIIEFFGLTPTDEDKVGLAKTIIESLLFQHSKDDLGISVNNLASMEASLRDIEIRSISIRDHVCHAVYTYCLGIYLIKNLDLQVTKFQWMLASLLHDVGYPLDLVMRLAKQLEATSNKFQHDLPVEVPSVAFTLSTKYLSRLTSGESAVRLMTNRLKEWQFPFTAGKFTKEMTRTGEINHGVVSSVFVCKFIERLYRKNNPDMISGSEHSRDHRDWNYDTFYNDIVSVATSILIHSLPKSEFVDYKINIDVHPLPFLLRFTDELQDWDRIGRNDEFNDPKNYAITFSDNRKVVIALPSDREHLQANFDCFAGMTLTFI